MVCDVCVLTLEGGGGGRTEEDTGVTWGHAHGTRAGGRNWGGRGRRASGVLFYFLKNVLTCNVLKRFNQQKEFSEDNLEFYTQSYYQ